MFNDLLNQAGVLEGKSMQDSFIEFLADRGLVTGNVASGLAQMARLVREPIGMIAVSHGLLAAEQIDLILDRQRECTDRFGEIAISLGFMSPKQVDALVMIQEFRSATAVAEALALGDALSFDDALRYLGNFLVKDPEVIGMIANG